MAEENKSQLISEAELIEAINADTLVSISLGAGQPQKNVKLSTLASVVAENIKPVRKRTVSLTNASEISVSLNGLTSYGEEPYKWTIYGGQWRKKDIFYAEGIFRVYDVGSEYNNAVVTGKSDEFTSLRVEIDSGNNLKVFIQDFKLAI